MWFLPAALIVFTLIVAMPLSEIHCVDRSWRANIAAERSQLDRKTPSRRASRAHRTTRFASRPLTIAEG
jgi:hypothetical protein